MSGSIEVFNAGQARRAALYRAFAHPGVRTALWVDLRSAALPAGHCLQGTAGFWLAESAQGTVGCYASATPPTGRSVGGRVVHDLPSLNPGAPWLQALAQGLAQGLARASDVPADAEYRTLQNAVSSFCAELDGEILAAVLEDDMATPAVYNHYCNANANLRRNRLQAALSHPRFASALRGDWRLRHTVDSGEALTPRLAEHHQVRSSTIKRIRQLARECIPAQMLSVVLKQADAFPSQSLPVSPEDWAVYLRLAPGLETLAQGAGIPQATLLQPFRRGWKVGLAALEQRLQAPLDLDATLEMMHCAYHYGVRPAVAVALSEKGRSPTLAESAPAPFFPLWFGRYGLARLAEIAQHWHEAHGQFSLERLAGVRGARRRAPLDWPPLLDTGASHGRLRVVELNSQAALELEGQRLEHCVASYAIKCLLAESAIFSIRDTGGVSLSTFEVRLPANGEAELLQHHAAVNEGPSAREQAVAERFVERVLARIPGQRIRAVQQARRERGLRVRGLLGKPDTLQESLSADELARLGEAIAVAHPAEARRTGLVPYLREHGASVLAAMGAS